MTEQETEDMTKERNNYLATLHTLRFSKENKDILEQMDIDRRSLAVKYLATKMFSSQDTAACVLSEGLKQYHKYMENKNGVNNYWRQFKAQYPNISNDPTQWKSKLTDPTVALEFIKPLSCQVDKTLPCANTIINDRHVERIVAMWKDKETEIRRRKINNKNPVDEDDAVSESKKNEDIPAYKNNATEFQNFSYKQPVRFVNKPQAKMQADYNTNVPKDKYNRFSQNKSIGIPRPLACTNANNDALETTRSRVNFPRAAANNEESETTRNRANPFKTAAELKKEQQAKANKPMQKKTLGGRVAVNAPFVCPLKRTQEEMEAQDNSVGSKDSPEEMSDERLKNIEPKMVELIKNEIMDSGTPISWDDIAGLEYAKKIIKEVVVFPMLRPDIFTGLRRPPKGILLFGPPGTGKTLIGKCIASQSRSTFFSISASSLTSKWVGEGEKMVRALFAVARVHQPSVIFIDEIDSLLTQRSETEHESSRRIKTEFLVQLDGAATSEEDRLLIVGATNRPQELDEAARRRLVKRLYIPLPELEARMQIVDNLLTSIPHDLTREDVLRVARQAQGFSGADMTNLCKEASMGPIRSIPFSQLENVRKEDVRKVTASDFADALRNVRPSVSQNDLSIYIQWDNTYGCGMAQQHGK